MTWRFRSGVLGAKGGWERLGEGGAGIEGLKGRGWGTEDGGQASVFATLIGMKQTRYDCNKSQL
jgi:hypothetical protein